MEKILISALHLGQVFDLPVFSLHGQKLLHAGVPLNPRHIDAIGSSGESEVVLAATIEELAHAGILAGFDRSVLQVGRTADASVATSAGQVLLEPGDQVEEHHLDALAVGGNAFVSRLQVKQQRRLRMLMSDAAVETIESQIPDLRLHVLPQADSKWLKPGDPKDWPPVGELTQWRNAQVEELRGHYARIEAGVPLVWERIDHLVQNLLGYLSAFPSRFAQLALLCPRREDYLPDHAYTVTVLSMGIATRLGWPLEDVLRVGRAGLLFDLGMLMISQRIRTGKGELNDADQRSVECHPIYSLALLQSVQDVPPIIQLAALQHHERENGTGYPRGMWRESVCDYAKVLAVADCFAAATEFRPYRPPKLPYIAMEETLRSSTAMALWKPAVRGLLQTAGHFPVGSFVKLSNGKSAHVVAANPRQLERPAVQIIDVDGRPDDHQVIDLSGIPVAELSVVRPIQGFAG